MSMIPSINPKETSFSYYIEHCDKESKDKFLEVFHKALTAIENNEQMIAIDEKTYTIENPNISILTKFSRIFFKTQTHQLQEKDLRNVLNDINVASSSKKIGSISEIARLKRLLILNTSLEEEPVASEMSKKILEQQTYQTNRMTKLQQNLNLENAKYITKQILMLTGAAVGTVSILTGLFLALFLNPALFVLIPVGVVLVLPLFLRGDSSSLDEIEEIANSLKKNVENFEILENVKVQQEQYESFLKKYGRSSLKLSEQRYIDSLKLFLEDLKSSSKEINPEIHQRLNDL